MAYPPPQSGYPYPSNQGMQSNMGFASCSRPGEGPGYSMYPQGGGGFPFPPAPSSGFGNAPTSSTLPYSISPGNACPYLPSTNISAMAYPPYSNVPYSIPDATSSLYPPAHDVGSSPYPSAPGSSLYPLASGSSRYLPASCSSSYPPASGSSPYPPVSGASPYPPAPGSSPYPSTPSSSLHPLPPSLSPYPQQSGADSAPHSSHPSSYPPAQGVPLPLNASYPPSNSSYPSVSTYPNNIPVCSSYQKNTNLHQNYSSPTSTYYSGSMWPYQERPTIRPSVSFDPSTDASRLRKAMKGFGTDEATIIQILGRRTSLERQQIIPRYQQSFGRDLIKYLRSELSGDFLEVMDALMVPLPEFLARQLNMAMRGVGTKERTLIEILCTSDNNTLRAVKASYQNLFRRPLEADIKGDTSGYFGRLMVAMAAAFRDETASNQSLAPGLAQSLYAAGAKKLGTDETEFIRILSTYSYPLLRCVFDEYRKISGGKTFEAAIKSELSGDLRNGMLVIYGCIENRAGFFAHHLHEAMKGFGTHDTNLIRIVVWRAEIDMGNIKDEFRKIYGKRLEDAISSETSGDYKKILLALIQG